MVSHLQVGFSYPTGIKSASTRKKIMHLEAEPFLEPGAGALTSPQFDDEKTLLSARPVVPLAEVSKARFRRQLPFVVGIGFLAIILCAVVLIQFSRADDKSQTGSSSRMGPSDRSPAKTSESVTDGGSVDSLSNDSSSNPEPRNPAVAAVTQPDEKPAANGQSAGHNAPPNELEKQAMASSALRTFSKARVGHNQQILVKRKSRMLTP